MFRNRPHRNYTAEELEVVNRSCDTCYFVRRPDFHQPEGWKCEAPQNYDTSIVDIVTGKFKEVHTSCVSAREEVPAKDTEYEKYYAKFCGSLATWRKAQFVVLEDGTYKHTDQDWQGKPKKEFQATGKLSTSLARLRGLTADDF